MDKADIQDLIDSVVKPIVASLEDVQDSTKSWEGKVGELVLGNNTLKGKISHLTELRTKDENEHTILFEKIEMVEKFEVNREGDTCYLRPTEEEG